MKLQFCSRAITENTNLCKIPKSLTGLAEVVPSEEQVSLEVPDLELHESKKSESRTSFPQPKQRSKKAHCEPGKHHNPS